MRTARVRRPRRTRKASNGPSVAPVSTCARATVGDERRGARDDAGDQVAVAAEVLRRRLDHEVRAELEGPADVRRRERVVDDVRRTVAWASVRERLVVGHEGGRVGRRFGVQDARRRGREGRGDGVGSVVSTRSTSTPKPPKCPQSWSRVEPYSASGQRPGRPRGGARRTSRGSRPCRTRGRARLAAGELRVGVPEGLRRRVGQPAVGEPGPGIANDVAERVGVRGGERRGLVDRDGRRRLVDARRARRGADGARGEAAWPCSIVVRPGVWCRSRGDATPA